jgi:uncharacterized membrane protein
MKIMESTHTRDSDRRSDQCALADINVSDVERTISTVAGACVLLYGLSKLSITGFVATLLGGSLVYRGVTGHCSMYEALGMSTACGGESGARHPQTSNEIGEASLAATGESPRKAAR